MELPAELAAAIERELEGKSPRELRAAVEGISARYRAAETVRSGTYIADEQGVAAYIVYRMAATYAATWAAMNAADEVLGADWRPRTVLDVGAGTGAATWAALDIWSSIEQATLIDQEPRMIEVGQRLAGSSSRSALREAVWTRRNIGALPDPDRYEVVVASYVYNEFSSGDRLALLRDLWARTERILVLVDPGTPRGFEGLREARTSLVNLGAHVVAPCPHSSVCPMAGRDWCHFAARVNRGRAHRYVKAGDLSYEDEKFAYVVVSREPVSQVASRVIRHPQIRKGHLSLELCTGAGLTQVTYSRRKSGDDYRAARSLRWGSAWETPEHDSGAI